LDISVQHSKIVDINRAQVTSKDTFVVLAQNGQIVFIRLYWTNWQV